MFNRAKLNNLNDYFNKLSSRENNGVYFYRINGYSTDIDKFIVEYYKTALNNGVILSKIQNPDEKNLEYYNEVMGSNFILDLKFIKDSLNKWLPRLNNSQADSVAEAMYNVLEDLKKNGKTDSIIKNTYIKFMCWLYYKFERIVNQLGNENIPKILYFGSNISRHELLLLSVLNKAGCDIVLVQMQGDLEYSKLDSDNSISDKLDIEGLQEFPDGYSLDKIKHDVQADAETDRLYYSLCLSNGREMNGTSWNKKIIKCSTNDWIDDNKIDFDKALSLIQTTGKVRHANLNEDTFYNCFFRVIGTEDKMLYEEKLFKFQSELKANKRNLVIVNKEIGKPTVDEVSKVNRTNYKDINSLIAGLAGNIRYLGNDDIHRIMIKSFVDTMIEAGKIEDNINRLTNKAVYLICWLNRYKDKLFKGWMYGDTACFVYLGGCKDCSESLFIKFLSKLPVDILILCPSQLHKCVLKDDALYEIIGTDYLDMEVFPEENTSIRTLAYNAERELDTLLYTDSGIYRDKQFRKINTINLKTMYEEIATLWKNCLQYRTGFNVTGDTANLPVIFAKVSGVKNGDIDRYWFEISRLITPDTLLITSAPYIKTNTFCWNNSVECYKRGKLDRDRIKSNYAYAYNILRDDIQNLILDKLQLMLDKSLIKGMGQNGTEYLVIAEILSLPKEVVRLIQKFDFTKVNPKVIYVHTGDGIVSIEDAIMLTFLNLIGFDIILFTPTGYNMLGTYINDCNIVEYQIGDYFYDLQVPDLHNYNLSSPLQQIKKFFIKRGIK